MREIFLSQGKVAFVDDDDFAYLNSFNWYAVKGSTNWYAVREEKINRRASRGCRKEARPKKKKRRKIIRMHNFIMEVQKDMTVHHKDGNGLNNQRSNLEECTKSRNQQYAAEKTNKERNETNI